MPRPTEVTFRSFEPLRGASIALGLSSGVSGTSLLERRGSLAPKATTFETPTRAFVALANRARALLAAGLVEDAPRSDAPLAALGLEDLGLEDLGLEDLGLEDLGLEDHDAIARYVGSIDATRSLPLQEMLIAQALTPQLARRDPRVAEMIATLTLLVWPVTFDVGALLAELDGPEDALARVLARELSRSRSGYPKELVRQAMIHGSAESCTLALRALSRTKDPDAWFDVLIEGDPFFDRSHVPALTALASRAPSKDIAKMAREIAKELAPARRPSKQRR